ncbi:TonB-dependent receptor [uncultured Oxalicibacterium sp.]|uniref:TonB-dependent receptor plug domain-containing protein n=1 Tax=uncultured Oxalicibacterium sp. TaxID=1168540 RepID=UPI0025F4C693|nr:TonB-dependent receptor [uncultured Oxalicibacterium sp.]
MKQPLSRTVLAASLMLAFGTVQAAEVAESSQVFALGEINVSGSGNTTPATGGSKVSREELDDFNRETVVDALNLMPGITTTGGGPRNERMMYLRGFDNRQVPVFIDGIPVYVSYDGYVDLARFTTYDIASIEVAKGFSSVLYGPNTLGGAINLISRKPVKAFEGDVGIGLRANDKLDGNGKSTYVNLGTNQGMWYAQLGLSYLDRDGYTLSRDFRPTTAQPNRERRNANSTDSKINLKFGLTPNATDEYAINYIKQKGEKGSPLYSGTLDTVRNWSWPAWNKESLYFISHTALGTAAYIKTRLYYDKFDNELLTSPTAIPSIYNDYTYGGSAEFGVQLGTRNLLKAALHMKEDIHREHNVGEPVQTSRDRTLSIGVEDTQKLTDKLDLVVGGSYDRREGRRAEEYSSSKGLYSFNLGDASAFNPQAGLIYHTSSTGNAYATIARKSRFPTIKDRYSFRMGTAIPNPDLTAERAMNYQIGFTEKISADVRMDASIFYSDITDMIQTITVPSTLCGGSTCNQMQNIGKVINKGVELGVTANVSKTIEIGGNYTYIDRENKSSPTVYLIDTPAHKLFAYAKWSATPRLDLIGNATYNSKRYSNSTGTRIASGFSLINAKLRYALDKGWSLEAGVNNLLDRNYAYSEGFYEEGRSLFANLNYRF